MNCTLIVPANPLTAQGLATPYQLIATNAADGPCDEANGGQTAFVQGAMIDPATGRISVYDPLVVDAGTQPAVAPVVPALPAGAVVALWFGYNGNTLYAGGPDQAQALIAAAPTASADSPADRLRHGDASPRTATATSTPTAAATATGTPTAAPPAHGHGRHRPRRPPPPRRLRPPTDTGTATATATPAATQPASTVAAQPSGHPQCGGHSGAPAAGAAARQAAVQAEGAAPLPPGTDSSSGYRRPDPGHQVGHGAKVSGTTTTRRPSGVAVRRPPRPRSRPPRR